MNTPPSIGIIGLGRMGSALAGRISGQGFPVCGWSRSGVSPAKVASLDIVAANGLEDLAQRSDIILTSLLDDAAVRSVLGHLAKMPLDRKLVVETSTIRPGTVKEMAPLIEEAGGRMIDAPISGWPEFVAAGKAGVFIGGSSSDIERFAPVAAAFSDRVSHIGAIGSGATMKVVNNMMLAGFWQSLSEALGVAVEAGLDLEQTLGIIAKGPAANSTLAGKMPVLLGEPHDVSFTIAGVAKDLDVYTGTARELGVDAPAIEAASSSFSNAVAQGHGDKDLAMMVRLALKARQG